MPYIDQKSRKKFSLLEEELKEIPEVNVGELTYLFYILSKYYTEVNGTKYQTFAEISGALNNTLQEHYRRVIVNYENKKIEENGDV